MGSGHSSHEGIFLQAEPVCCLLFCFTMTSIRPPAKVFKAPDPSVPSWTQDRLDEVVQLELIFSEPELFALLQFALFAQPASFARPTLCLQRWNLHHALRQTSLRWPLSSQSPKLATKLWPLAVQPLACSMPGFASVESFVA